MPVNHLQSQWNCNGLSVAQYPMRFLLFIMCVCLFLLLLLCVRVKGKAREGEDVMVFCSKVHWLLCRVILIGTDGHFPGDSGRRTQCI